MSQLQQKIVFAPPLKKCPFPLLFGIADAPRLLFCSRARLPASLHPARHRFLEFRRPRYLVFSNTTNSSDPIRQPRPAREFVGYILAAAYIAIVCVSLWHLRGQQAEGRIDGIEAAMHLLLLATIGGTTAFLYRLARRVRADVREKARLVRLLHDRETTYRAMFDNAIEGMFQTTPEGKYIAANRALARMFGYESPEQMIGSVSDIGRQLYADPARREFLFEALKNQDTVSDFEAEFLRADGGTFWARGNVNAVRDGGGKLLYLEGTAEDISARHWGEQRRRLQDATARVLGEAASVVEARPKILESICAILEWKMGAVWDVDAQAGLLRCVEIWHTPDVDIAEFEEENAGTTYESGSGLAGAVWQSGEPKWIANLAAEASFAAARIAVKSGMGSAFGVPIAVRGEVRHVLEFFSPKIASHDPELLQTLSVIGGQLGHLIERKNAEEALRKSEMRKAAIFDAALDCIVSFDAEGRIGAFNPAAERAFGYSAAEVLGREAVAVMVPEPMCDLLRRALARSESSPELHMRSGRRFEMRAVRRDGTQFPVEVTVSRVVIDGAPLFTAYLRDIAARKKAQHATAELAAVVENSNDAIVVCTLEGVVSSWNIGAERIYGYTAAEAVGQPLQMIFPPDRSDEFPQMLTAVNRGESLANYETVRLRKDGRKIGVSLTDSPIRAERGRITGVSSIARDITERKRLEEDLLQSQKMDAVGRLAGGIAHDFNNILTAIVGYSDLLLSQVSEQQTMHKHLTQIRKAADFAAALTGQLLAFSRRQPLHPRVFGLNDTVRGLQKMLQRVIGEDVKVVTNLCALSGRIKADPSQIEQVLLNLCVNSRDAMPRGGTIRITTEDTTYALDDEDAVNTMPAGEYVKLTIADTGEGIPPEVLKHVFEPFFTTKEKGHGTGLGLATCYGVVKQSGGYISLKSGVGAGTTFAIFLPRVDEAGAKPPLHGTPGKLPGGHETILYVEDEITVRNVTAQILRALGYTVLEAGDGLSARQVVEMEMGRAIDMLFSDVVLPDAGGRELSDWMRARSEQTKLLFTSGYIDESILRRHGLEGGTAFLQKPFSPMELARKVRETMDD